MNKCQALRRFEFGRACGKLVAVLLGLWLGAGPVEAAPAKAPVKLGAVQSSCATVKRYERCELTIELTGTVANPYDPQEVTLEAAFAPSQGKPVTVFGFYYQPFTLTENGTRQTIRSAGSPVWKVRFTPTQLGRWSYRVKLTTPEGTQEAPGEPFLVVESSRPGFVRFDRARGNFRFDTGAPFIPIGENLCWGPSVQPLKAYDTWFRALSRNRANFIRVWMAPWLLRLETKDTGMGRYDQERAFLLDALLERSEDAGIYWQLCLLNHGAFSRSQDADWHNNPYNVKLGGICKNPNDFLTDPRATGMFERLLRYLVSRWGFSTQLVVWELFNEADFGEFKPEDLVAWTGRMSAVWRDLDPQHRPVTTSFHQAALDAVWRLPSIDLVQLHVYDRRDFADVFGGPLVAEPRAALRKPVVIGEFGWTDEVMRKFDDAGIHVHEGLWASLMGGSSGSALVWFWDSYVNPNRLERHFRGLEAFWRGEQVRKDLPRMALSLSDPKLMGLGVGDADRLYLWIKNRAHSVDAYVAYRCAAAKQRLRQVRGEAVSPVTYAPAPVRGAVATIKGLDWVGRYRIEWWDPYRGRIAARTVASSEWGTLTVEVPDVGFDVAAKCIKLQWWERG